MDEEVLVVWGDVLDEIVAGRKEGLTCPECGHHPLEVTETPLAQGGAQKIGCRGCGKVLEGRFSP